MKKAEKIGIIAALCGIILLFLIASTDFVLEENRKEVYTIAFVTDGSADDRFQSLRKGMEKAAKKWNVDLVVDAPYLSGNAAEQEAAIEEAVENGAQAVITVPADQVQMENSGSEQASGSGDHAGKGASFGKKKIWSLYL